MAMQIYAVVNQKGGVGKSAIADSIALELAKGGARVLLADLDTIQKSSFEWYENRQDKMENLVVKVFKGVKDVANFATSKKGFDYLVVDGAAHASEDTLNISAVAHRIFIPTGSALSDLKPSARLALEMIRKGVDPKRIRMVLSKISTESEALTAKLALEEQGLKVFGHLLRQSPGYILSLDAGRGLQESNYPTLRAHAQTLISALIKK